MHWHWALGRKSGWRLMRRSVIFITPALQKQYVSDTSIHSHKTMVDFWDFAETVPLNVF